LSTSNANTLAETTLKFSKLLRKTTAAKPALAVGGRTSVDDITTTRYRDCDTRLAASIPIQNTSLSTLRRTIARSATLPTRPLASLDCEYRDHCQFGNEDKKSCHPVSKKAIHNLVFGF
jgi:hypothetical protein